jgi:hypothetical protein
LEEQDLDGRTERTGASSFSDLKEISCLKYDSLWSGRTVFENFCEMSISCYVLTQNSLWLFNNRICHENILNRHKKQPAEGGKEVACESVGRICVSEDKNLQTR